MIDTGAYLSALASDSEAFVDLAAGKLDRHVPACPDWTVARLAGHLGGVYSWATLVAGSGGERPTAGRDEPPVDPDQLDGWFREHRAAVLDALTAREPDEPAWVFVRKEPGDIGWWRRRQAHETAVHLHDMEEAVGSPGTMDPELAADGADEILTELVPSFLARRPVAEMGGTLHVHATDAEGEWFLDFTGPAAEVRREHAKADTAVRGPAAGLFLWLWNRATPEDVGLEIFGDASILRSWPQVRL